MIRLRAGLRAGAFVAIAVALAACARGAAVSPPTTPGQLSLESLSGPTQARAQGASCARRACVYVVGPLRRRPHARALAFAADASGNVPPLARIRGPQSGIVRPRSIALDADRYLYAANYADSFPAAESVTVYPPGAGANTPPVQTIAGPHTQLYQPLGIAVDRAKDIYVLNWNSVSVFAPGATGDVAPIRTLKGPNTRFVNPTGIAVSDEGRIYITTLDGPNGGTFYVFAAGANGNTAPAQIINGPDDRLQQPVAVAVDARGFIYVVNEIGTGSGVVVYHRDANGDARPVRVLVGPQTGLHVSRGIALDGEGNMYLPSDDAPVSPPAILVFAAAAHGNVAPLRTIAGGLTDLSFETGIAVR
jgi:hypothetical protein